MPRGSPMRTNPAMSITALIPARGGSKGIPRKNLVPLRGKPLLAHTIECALAVPLIDQVFVSTDDDEIAACAEACGARAPFRRPAACASDDAPMIAVLQHALGWIEAREGAQEAIVLLQPTSPLRRAESVGQAIRLFRETHADSVVSIVAVPHNCSPGSLLSLSADGRVIPAFPNENATLRRQEKPRFFARNGPAILVLRPEFVKSGRLYSENTHGFEMGKIESLDIDDAEDLSMVEALLTRGGTAGGEKGPLPPF